MNIATPEASIRLGYGRQPPLRWCGCFLSARDKTGRPVTGPQTGWQPSSATSKRAPTHVTSSASTASGGVVKSCKPALVGEFKSAAYIPPTCC